LKGGYVIPAVATEAVAVGSFPLPVSERLERRQQVETEVVATLIPEEVEALVPIRSETDIVAARQHGRTLAMQLGFATTDATLVATAISELARNIILYAGRGAILLRPLKMARRPGVLVIARDEGPGIADPPRALAGGYSTSGGLGLGLCGVRRLVDEFDLASEPGRGTTVTFKKWKA
jgi:serine/threonine-protein kinase RsbT